MELAERIGKTAFEFNFLFSIIITVIGTALLANGINPGSQVRALFLPMDWMYRSTSQIQQNLPKEFNPISVITSIGAAGIISIVLEFIFMMLLGFLVLVYTLSTIIPPQLTFLTVPLFFLGAFIQLMVWVYVLNIIFDKLSNLIPFKR